MPEYIYTARTPEGKLKKDRIRMKDEKRLKAAYAGYWKEVNPNK